MGCSSMREIFKFRSTFKVLVMLQLLGHEVDIGFDIW